MKKIVLRYGLIAGAIIVLFMTTSMSLMGKELHYKIGEVFGYASMIIALSTIFVGIRKYRDEELGGFISFGKAFQVGLFITLVASALYVTGWMIYSATGTGQEFMANYLDATIAQLRQSGISEAEVDQKVAEMEAFMEMYKNPIVKIGMTFLEIFPVGLIISLIAAALLRKSKTTPSLVG